LTSAALDRLLAVLVVAMATTGLATLRVGHPDGAWLFVAHGLLAGALAGAIAIKVRRSLPRALDSRRIESRLIAARRIGRVALSLLVTLVAAAALSGGWLWAASGEIVWLDGWILGRWTLLTLHAWIGLALVPLVVVHLLPRRWRLLRPGPATLRRAGGLLSRRSLLAGAALGALGLGAFASSAILEVVRGGSRRFTGSRWLPAGGVPPATTFFGEPVPAIDHARWRLEVTGAVVQARSFSLGDLRTLGALETTAVLDCTSGWALETSWTGIPLAALLEASGVVPGAREVAVRSVTGWSTVLPAAEIAGASLAWEVAGQPLPDANGAPLRLVVANRRGLDWVKWVNRIEVS